VARGGVEVYLRAYFDIVHSLAGESAQSVRHD